MNDGWAAESKTLTWEQAVAAAEAGRMKARTALEALGEVDEAAATWFTDETFEHYRGARRGDRAVRRRRCVSASLTASVRMNQMCGPPGAGAPSSTTRKPNRS